MTTQPASGLRVVAATSRRQTIAVLLLALAFRGMVVWSIVFHQPRNWFYLRGTEMGFLAQSVALGHGLGSPFGIPTGPSAMFAPGYPLLAAAVFRIFGIFSMQSAAVLMLLNLIANLVTIWLIMHLARTLCDSRAALLAGLFWALSPPLMWMPSIFWDTSLTTVLLVGMVALALQGSRRPSRPIWLVLGGFAALATLINPALLLCVLAIAAWAAYNTWATHRSSILLAVLVFAVIFSPWPIRNARVFHAFVPLRTAMGYDLWMGNRPGSDGMLDGSLFPTYNKAELSDYTQHGEIAYTNNKSALAKAYIRAQPGTFVRVSARRFLRYWTGSGNDGGSIIYLLHALTTTLFGLAGLWILARTHRGNLAVLFALPLLLFPLPYYIAHAEFRYRLVVDPVMTVLAAVAIIAIVSRKHAPQA